MVWTHGGGFTLGESLTPMYNGANLVKDQENLIVVVQLVIFRPTKSVRLLMLTLESAAASMSLVSQVEMVSARARIRGFRMFVLWWSGSATTLLRLVVYAS